MDYRDVPPFMAALRQRPGIPARALEFLILTAARTAEVIGTTWPEIDFDAKVWTVTGSRMKSGREHRVPLSEPALAILRAMPGRSGFVFSGELSAKVHPHAMSLTLRRMGVVGYTIHGFRSSFRDWAGNETNFPREVCESALAHNIGNAVEIAYRGATPWPSEPS